MGKYLAGVALCVIFLAPTLLYVAILFIYGNPEWGSILSGYLGLLLTFGLPWAIFAVLLAPLQWWSWATLLAAVVLRAAVALKVGVGVVQDEAVRRNLWLLPLRDLVAFWVWFASFADNKVHWRGDVFILENGKIRPAHPRGPERLSAAKPDQDFGE